MAAILGVGQVVSRGHTRPLTEISFVPDPGVEKTILVSSAHDKLPQIRDGESGDWIGSFEGHKGAVWSCQVDAATRTLCATASGDFSAKLWCATTGKELHEFKHKHVVKCVSFSHDTMNIITGCPVKVFWAGESEPNSVIIGKRDGKIEKWDIRQKPEAGSATSSIAVGSAVMDAEYSPAHGQISVAVDNKVVMLDASTLSTKREYSMPTAAKNMFAEEGGVSLHPDGSKFIAGGADLWLREFDCATGEVLRTFKGHHGPIRCVRYHPSGKFGASGSEDATIRIWEL
eukprot:GSChrysophyteH1.ASY1.ANO1.1693.1 assembled CDS